MSFVDPEIGWLGDVDTANVTLQTKDGTMSVILISRRCVFGFYQRIEAFGSQGLVMSDNPRQSGFYRYLPDPVGSPTPISGFFMERYSDSCAVEIHLTGLDQEFDDV